MTPLHAAPLPPSSASASRHFAHVLPLLAKPSPCSLTTVSPLRKAFLSCTDHNPAAVPPRNGRSLAPASSAFPTSPALITSVQDLYDFILKGPLVERIGYSHEKIAKSIDRWLRCGVQVCRLFRIDELRLSEAEKARIYHFYIPVFLWCEDQVLEHRSKYDEDDDIPPLVCGRNPKFSLQVPLVAHNRTDSSALCFHHTGCSCGCLANISIRSICCL